MGPAGAYTLVKDRSYLISIYMDYVKLNPYLASKSHLLLIHTLLDCLYNVLWSLESNQLRNIPIGRFKFYVVMRFLFLIKYGITINQYSPTLVLCLNTQMRRNCFSYSFGLTVSVLDSGSGDWVCVGIPLDLYIFFHFNKFQKITEMFVNILLTKLGWI